MRRTHGVLFAAALMLLATGVEAAKKDRTPEQERLVKEGADRWADGTFEQRRKALDVLEQAAALAPKDPNVLTRLAHAYLDAGYSHDAKETFERITVLAPADADPWEGLGR